MKTTWIMTESGLYMEIIDPDWEELEDLRERVRNETDKERMEAVQRYIEKRYLGKDPDA